MPYTIENVNDCTKKLIFNFETVDLTQQVESALKSKQKTSNLKGFRKGKAPLSMIKKMYGPQLENEALYQFVSQQFYEAIQKEELKAVGYPRFDKTEYNKEDKKVVFEAVVEIFPEFELKDYKGYQFTKGDETIVEEDVEKTIKGYLESKAAMVEITDESTALSNGLFAVLNFEGEKEDGEKPANMKGEEFLLEIGSGQFIPGFEEQLVGLKKDEKKSIEVTFPADYQEESLQNAPVTFHIEILEIKEKKYPELNDELAKELGFDSISNLQEKTRANLEAQKKREVQTKLQEEILKKLVAENSFDVPQALIDQQKKAIRDDLEGTLKQQGFNEDMLADYFEKWNLDVEERALFQVRSGLILDYIAKNYQVEAAESDLDAKLEEMSAQSGMSKDQLEGYYKANDNIKRNLMYSIREEKTFEKLIEDMKIS